MGNYLVLGAGRIGRAIAYDILKSKKNKVNLVDKSSKNLDEATSLVKCKKRIECFGYDVTSKKVEELMGWADMTIGAASYEYNHDLTKKALINNSHFIDLGGNNIVVEKQFALGSLAKKKDLTVIPDCGVTPGLVSIIVADAMNEIGYADEVRIRVGGLPKEIPNNPLKYMITFSPTGLINEYIEECNILKGGKLEKVPGLSGLETISFEGFPKMEAFNTSGGTSTLPRTYAGRISNLDCKTIRYEGHCEKIKKLLDVFEVRQGSPGFRKDLEKMITSMCSYEGKDMLLMRVTVKGNKTIAYEMVDYQDDKGFTAMMRTTGFTASIIAQMISNNKIKERGVLPQELAVPSTRLMEELKKRNIIIKKTY